MNTDSTISSSPEDRLARARCSLEGLSVGDALGEHFMARFLNRGTIDEDLPPAPWYFTDDTYMALSIIAVLRQEQVINQDLLSASFASRYMQEPHRGYGRGMHTLLRQIASGQPWQVASRKLFAGQGSFGNGAAMRVAPLGAYFADSLEMVVEQARLSAEVTHAHAEGVAGAIATAVAAAWAWRLRTDSSFPNCSEFLDLLLPSIPDSEVHTQIRRARDLGNRLSVTSAAATLGNGSQVSAQDTVPFVLWCAGQYLGRYEEAIRQTLRVLGDCDTNCAMVGGIVALSSGISGIPAHWLTAREPLPDWPFQEQPAWIDLH